MTSDKQVTIMMFLEEAKALAFFVPVAEETYTPQGINLANAHAKLAKAIRHAEVGSDPVHEAQIDV